MMDNTSSVEAALEKSRYAIMQCDYTFCIVVCVQPKSSELGIFNLKHNLFFNPVNHSHLVRSGNTMKER